MKSSDKRFTGLRARLAMAALAGTLYFLGFCGFGQFYLAWICLIPVLWALDDPNLGWKRALLIAWAFGWITHLGGYTWINGLLVNFAFLPWPVAGLGWMLLCAAQGSLLACWGLALYFVLKQRRAHLVWGAPALMVALEWFYPSLFPHYLANSHYRQLVFIQSLDIWGPLGLTFLITAGNTLVYDVVVRVRSRASFPIAATAGFTSLMIFNTVYGFVSIPNRDDDVRLSEKRVKIGVVQANMGIYQKHENPTEGLRRHREQSLELERQGADLIVWPESAYNYVIYEGTRNIARTTYGPLRTPVLFGGLRIERKDGERRLYNTAFLANENGDLVGTYDKTYLLAFGEYLPGGETFPFLYKLSPHTSHFWRGNHTKPLVLNDVKYGVLICYEDVLPWFVRKVMDHNPDILVNITNDAWFGDTEEPQIHLAMASFRAVEHRRFLVRSTNTGISAFVDPVGRILKPTSTFARANISHDVVGLTGRTFYARFGDWLGWLCTGYGLFLLWPALRRLRQQKSR